jgi:hypothetical protein
MTRTSRLVFVDVPILGAVVVAALAFALGYVLRYVVIEPDIRGIVCNETADPPLWCGPRQLLIVVVQTLPGRWLTVALAAAAWVGGGRWARWGSLVALVIGIALAIHYFVFVPQVAPLSPSAAAAMGSGMAAVYAAGPVLTAVAAPIALASWLGGNHGRWFAWAAMATGGIGAVLYNAGPGVISLAIAALRLIGCERLSGGSR